MASRSPLNIAIHDSGGLHLIEGVPSYGKECSDFSFGGKVKTFATSTDGKKFAFLADGCVKLAQIPSWRIEHSLEHPTAQEIVWSPGGGYLGVWCLYVKKEGTGNPNLHIYDTREGCTLLKSFFQISQLNWHPQWTGNDAIFARSVTNEVHFFKAGDLSTVIHKRVQPKLKCFSLSPSTSNHNVVFFTPSVKGAPCTVHMYKYPQFKEGHVPTNNKSFYKVDALEFFWNKPCNAVLLLTSAEKGDDKSYYGERMVFLMNSKTEESIKITFSKEGPVTAVCWTPDGKYFLSVFGNNPACCSMFDNKGNIVHSFDQGARNLVLVNPVSNLVMVGGCGNISPRIEVWELTKNKRICIQECPDVTLMQWSPCGEYLLTSTCSPRLRVNNGYRIYHYSGSLLMEYLCPKGTELYCAEWLPSPAAAVPFTPSYAKVSGIQSSVKTASTERYIPPGQRNAMSEADKNLLNCKQFLSQIDKYDSRKAIPHLPVGMPVGLNIDPEAKNNKKKKEKEDKTPDRWRDHCGSEPPASKSRSKNQKRREAKRQKDEEAQVQKNTIVIEEPDFSAAKKGAKQTEEPDFSAAKKGAKQKQGTVAPGTKVTQQQMQPPAEGEKKVKAIKKKLQRIEALKKDRSQGKDLDKNQITMIKTEADLTAQLKELTV